MKRSSLAQKLGDINELLKATPELNNYPVETWERAHDFLKKEGFSSEKFSFMISQNPNLLTAKQEKIFNNIGQWRAFQFGNKATIKLLEQNPELLLIEHSKELTKKFEMIKDFVGGGTNVYKLLLNSPDVLLQSVPVITDKINYLKDVMKADPVEVYKSAALSQEFITIKTRHVFLQRMGLYIVKKKVDPNEISKNPKLYQITDTSDRRFATKVCFVTSDEFETFQELHMRELETDYKRAKWSDYEVEEDNDEDEDGDDEIVKEKA